MDGCIVPFINTGIIQVLFECIKCTFGGVYGYFLLTHEYEVFGIKYVLCVYILLFIWDEYGMNVLYSFKMR